MNGARSIVRHLTVVCFAALVTAHSAAASPDDRFLAKHTSELANAPRFGFAVTFADDRRTFRVGETIPLVDTGYWYNLERCDHLGMAEAVLDHADGTGDVGRDLHRNGLLRPGCGVPAGGPGGVVMPDGTVRAPTPRVTVYLNQDVRFDLPGHYRFYVRAHYADLYATDRTRGPQVPEISDVLSLDIVRADANWEAQTLAAAVDALDHAQAFESRLGGARTLRFLGTHAAVDQELARFDRDPRASGNDLRLDEQFLRGLYGAPDRAYVVARMEAALDDIDRYISPQFLSTVAMLRATARTPGTALLQGTYDAALHRYAAQRGKALRQAGRPLGYLREPITAGAALARHLASTTLVATSRPRAANARHEAPESAAH